MDQLELEDNFSEANLENLVLKTKTFYMKKAFNKTLIIIPILLVLGIAVFLIIYFLLYRGGKIICLYETTKDKEDVQLININDDITFSLKIDENEYDGIKKYTFEKAGLHRVIFHFKQKLDSLDDLFKGLSHLIEVDFSELVTEEIKSMSSTFAYCNNLKKVNFNKETPNLEDMSYMFFSCESLNNINLKLDTSKVKRIDFMFYNCHELVYLDLSSFNLENLSKAPNMFAFCTKLKEIKFKDSTRTSNLEEMTEIFSHCESLEHINTKIFKTKKIKNLNYIFENCFSLKELDLSHLETENIVEAIGTFKNCRSLESLNISNLDTSKLKKISHIFYGCSNLTSINLPSINTNELLYASNAFYNCQSLTSLDLSSFNFGKLISAKNMFHNCINIKTLILPNRMTSLIRTNNMFENCNQLQSLNLGFLENANNWHHAEAMFKNCQSLTDLEFPSVKASYFENTEEMFLECRNLARINLGGLTADNIIKMNGMFYNCINLNYLNIYNFNTKNAGYSSSILYGVGGGKKIDINFNPNITNEGFKEELQNLMPNVSF